MMITAIHSSDDLAYLLNTSAPATPEDAAETPRDWLAGLWVAGTVYSLDPEATTDTLAVLADGTAAVKWSPRGDYCGGGHCTGVQAYSAHWCAASTDSWSEEEDARGVSRDWRTVNTWDANGFSETETCATMEEAEVLFASEVEALRETARILASC